jgi:2-polyprenyl-3-methyl-5-hydroxy-6-metoxy-1,4-benzoquinol methylase
MLKSGSMFVGVMWSPEAGIVTRSIGFGKDTEMTSTTAKTSDLLSTQDRTAHLQWSRLLELQVTSFLPYELQYLLNSEVWKSAGKILDAGCGSGFYLSQIKRFFPDKSYSGIDISEEHIGAAVQNSQLNGVELSCSDFFSYATKERFDVVVMRLIVQHLSDVVAILRQLEQLLVSDGTVIILEPEPMLFRNHPVTPLFVKLLRDYALATAAHKINRADLENLESKIAQTSNWKIAKSATMIVPRIGPFSSDPLMEIFGLWIDIFERSKAVTCDFGGVRHELDAWAKNQDCYNQVGLKILEIRRMA